MLYTCLAADGDRKKSEGGDKDRRIVLAADITSGTLVMALCQQWLARHKAPSDGTFPHSLTSIKIIFGQPISLRPQ